MRKVCESVAIYTIRPDWYEEEKETGFTKIETVGRLRSKTNTEMLPHPFDEDFQEVENVKSWVRDLEKFVDGKQEQEQ